MMAPLSSLPWKTHAVLSIVCPMILVTPPFLVHGLGPEDWLTSEILMSYGFYIFAWIVTAPFIWIEVSATLSHRPDLARVSAVFAHSVLAFVGTLPVTLHYVLALSVPDPVGIDLAQSASASYALLLAGYFVTTIAVGRARTGAPRDNQRVRSADG